MIELINKQALLSDVLNMKAIAEKNNEVFAVEFLEAMAKKIHDMKPVDDNELMTLDNYQRLASRTINDKLMPTQIENHALFGLASELGEIHGIYQKKYQGHEVSRTRVFSELGDLLWFAAELCTVNNVTLGQVAEANIKKLIKRYPDGFDEEKSLHRAKGDL